MLQKNISITTENDTLKNQNENMLRENAVLTEQNTVIYTQLEKSKQSQEALLKKYKQEENEYRTKANELYTSYKQLETKINNEFNELNKLKATRVAAQKAQLEEQRIKEERAFYSLPINDEDKNNIKVLENIKPQLSKPRILSMLIWSTFFQKPMNTLCNNVLGTDKVVSGIYKITNQLNDKSYIGQSTNIAERWKTHAKCGLGIDTPSNNKLYQEMQRDGIWNFTWEVLEKCPKAELNEKEHFYIKLYDSEAFGLNSNKGINK